MFLIVFGLFQGTPFLIRIWNVIWNVISNGFIRKFKSFYSIRNLKDFLLGKLKVFREFCGICFCDCQSIEQLWNLFQQIATRATFCGNYFSEVVTNSLRNAFVSTCLNCWQKTAFELVLYNSEIILFSLQ